MKEGQPTLFDNPDVPTTPSEGTIDPVAAEPVKIPSIAERTDFDPTGRVSEAAADQGWGPAPEAGASKDTDTEAEAVPMPEDLRRRAERAKAGRPLGNSAIGATAKYIKGRKDILG